MRLAQTRTRQRKIKNYVLLRTDENEETGKAKKRKIKNKNIKLRGSEFIHV